MTRVKASNRIRETAPELTEMITVVPEDLSTRIGLSPTLEPKLEEVMDMLSQSLLRHETCFTAKLPVSSA